MLHIVLSIALIVLIIMLIACIVLSWSFLRVAKMAEDAAKQYRFKPSEHGLREHEEVNE